MMCLTHIRRSQAQNPAGKGKGKTMETKHTHDLRYCEACRDSNSQQQLKFGPVSGEIYDPKSGLVIAHIVGLRDDEPVRDKSTCRAWGDLFITAVNSHTALTAQVAELTERIKKHIKNELRQKDENASLAAALDACVEALEAARPELEFLRRKRLQVLALDKVDAALAQAKKARG